MSLGSTEIYGVGKELENESMENVNVFGHGEVASPMFKELLPFSADGYGTITAWIYQNGN